MVIDGKAIAENIKSQLKALPKQKKFLAAVLVGEDAASVSFLSQKEKTAKELGVDFRLFKLSADIKNDELREEVGKIAGHKTCGGVIVQLPLPSHLNRHYALNAIPPEKDVDVLGERSLGSFYVDRGKALPPAVGAVKEIITAQKLELKKMRVVVIGRGLLVGRPVASWLMSKAREVTVFGRDGDIALLKDADLVIAGVGKTGLITTKMLKPGAVVIDFGYDTGKGDLDPAGAEEKNISYTKTPGGTGPILVAKLFENFYSLNSTTQ